MASINRYTSWAVESLENLKDQYRNSGLDPVVVAGRLSALQGRIEILKAVPINLDAYPWNEDVL